MPDVDLTYTAGTCSVGVGDTTVVGVATLWAQPTNVRQWDMISIDGGPLVPIIAAPTNDLALSIPAWTGAAKVGVTYVIYQISPRRFVGSDAMTDVETMLAGLNTDGWYRYVNPAFADPTAAGLVANEGQFALKYTTGQLWIMSGGVWVSVGIYSTFIFDTTNPTYNPATTYPARQLVSFSGKVWFSLQAANLNHQPDISPTWWLEFISGGDTVFIAMDDSDRPASGEKVLKFVAKKIITFNATMSDSGANADVGATLDAIYSIRKNNVEFATCKFAAGGQGGVQTGAFTCVASVAFAVDDILTMIAPNPRDATLSGIAICLTGYR